jgi:mono/diheme cytochrome c family protein
MRRALRLLVFPALALTLATAAAAQDLGGNAEARKMKNPHPATAASVEAGKVVFMKTCRFCHGDDGKGAAKTAPKNITPPPDLTDDKWDRGSSDGEIFAVIKNGAGPKFEMKPMKALTDDQMWDVVNYLRSLGPTKK